MIDIKQTINDYENIIDTLIEMITSGDSKLTVEVATYGYNKSDADIIRHLNLYPDITSLCYNDDATITIFVSGYTDLTMSIENVTLSIQMSDLTTALQKNS